MKVIGVDLALTKPIRIVGLTSRGRLVFMHEVDPHKRLWETARAILYDVMSVEDKAVVITEIPFRPMDLVKLYGATEYAFSEAGYPFFGIYPSSWQNQILKPRKGDDRKKLSIKAAEGQYGGKFPHPINHDEADAINIAVYGMKNSRKLLSGK